MGADYAITRPPPLVGQNGVNNVMEMSEDKV